jgi:hypothetical protein
VRSVLFESMREALPSFFLCYISKVGFADPVWETRILRVSFDNESSVLKKATLADSCERSLDLLLLRRKAAARTPHSN